MGTEKPTKNDIAWEQLFDKYKIIDKINTNGFYEIQSKDINEFRESRLMAKFDHKVNLPSIFKKHKISILPVSRNKYVLGQFQTYHDVKYSEDIENIPINFPTDIQSIDFNDLYSESSAIHCAYVSGIISDLMQEDAIFTLGGRMSTNTFDFNIKSSNKLFPVKVENSQCEIDAGFESSSKLMILEAKNFEVEDFLVRQLYYPYRLWQDKVSKKVIPTFMTYSNDIFSFFEYEFIDCNLYNSLRLVKQRNYMIAPEKIELEDIYQILNDVKIVEEPKVPFPQANRFERVVDLLGILYNKDLSKDEITSNYQFAKRQTDYYTNSGIYLGLVNKYKDKDTNEIMYTLSEKGRQVMKMRYKQKYLYFVRCILEHESFNVALRQYFDTAKPLNKESLCRELMGCYIYNVDKESSTLPRRAESVMAWIDWILDLPNK